MSHDGGANGSVLQWPLDFDCVSVFGSDICYPTGFQSPIDFKTALGYAHDAIYDLMITILRPVIGLPIMQGNGAFDWLVWTEADTTNEPWGDLIRMDPSSFYWGIIVPLSVVLLLIATGLVALRAGTLSRHEAKRQFRRLGLAFLAIFFWLPIASTAMMFFHKLSYFIVAGGPGGGAVGSVLDNVVAVAAPSFTILLSGGIIGAALAPVSFSVGLPILLLLLTLILIPMFALMAWIVFRWIIIVALTMAMPIIAVFWAVDVFPFKGISNFAESAASAYPGLLLSGLPAAFIFRLLYEVSDWGLGGWIDAVMTIVLLPTIIYVQVVTIRYAAGTAAEANPSSGAMQKVQRSGSRAMRSRTNSSRAAKTDTEPVDGHRVLGAVSEMRVNTWLTDGEAVVNEGPDAETVRDALGVGRGDDLDEVDAYGVTLASVKALARVDDATDAAVDALENEVEESAARVDALTEESRRTREHSEHLSGRVDDLERRVDAMTADSHTTDDDESDQ